MSVAGDGLSIIYIGTLPPHPGGTAILGSQILRGLSRLGHRIHAVSPITEEKLDDGDLFAENYPELALTRFIVPHFESAPNEPAGAEYRNCEGAGIRKAVDKILQSEKPDIIIGGRETFFWHVPDIAARSCAPSVLLIQGGTTAGLLNGTLPKHEADGLLHQFRRAKMVIVVANHLARTVKQLGLSRVKIIPNGVDLTRFHPRARPKELASALSIGEADVVCSHISNLKQLKRPLDIVDAAREAILEVPNLVFVIVGEGSLRESMMRRCNDYGIEHHFRFCGWVEHDQITEYINLSDMVLMPSESEARALVYLETQACERVLIASDIPAAREAVNDEETGLLFRKGDSSDLVLKIVYAARDRALRERIGKRAREQVSEYSMDALVSKYDQHLRMLASESS